jgi:hypothetical protein
MSTSNAPTTLVNSNAGPAGVNINRGDVRSFGGQPLPRKPYDPLARIPSPEALRERLSQTLALAEKLRILLELAERLHQPVTTADHAATPGTKGEKS